MSSNIANLLEKPIENVRVKVDDKFVKGYEHTENTIVTLPAGNYYIGDLCHAMKDEIYFGIFIHNDCKTGHYISKSGWFLLDTTSYGDGCYKGTNGFVYNVDAGIIGIASLSVCYAKNKIKGGTIHKFTEPVQCKFNDGVFEFLSGNWHLKINTIGDDNNDDASY